MVLAKPPALAAALVLSSKKISASIMPSVPEVPAAGASAVFTILGLGRIGAEGDEIALARRPGGTFDRGLARLQHPVKTVKVGAAQADAGVPGEADRFHRGIVRGQFRHVEARGRFALGAKLVIFLYLSPTSCMIAGASGSGGGGGGVLAAISAAAFSS